MEGQVKLITGAFCTVNVATQVFDDSQSDVTVNVTDFDPPHAEGAPLLLFVVIGLQPPVTETELNQFANLESMVDCD